MTIRRTQKYPLFGLGLCAVIGIVGYFSMNLFEQENIPPVPENPPYKNTTLPIDERVANLMSYMTLSEKVGQMALVEKNSVDPLSDIRSYGLGGVLSGFGGKPEDNTPAGWKEMIYSFISESRSSRLGIPVLYGVDAIHGHSNVPGATVFPHFIGLGASGDATLVEHVARATREELLATGVKWSYSPTYDMPEDIRWGRVYETFSDDPVLVGKLGLAYIQGLQGETVGTGSISVLATPKHYIGVGSMQWNTSSNENFKIDQGATVADEEKLRTVYLPPFQKAVEGGAMSVMVGLNTWGSDKLAASKYLIQSVLKDELSFDGFVVSDWYGVYEIPGGKYTAAVTAINAGVDMVMLPFEYQKFTRDIRRAVKNGDISEERLNDAVERILTTKFRLGLFDKAEELSLGTVGAPEHRALAREAVAKSLVLLKNNRGVLPIGADVTTIRVAGSAADNVGRQAGAWTVEWQGVDGNWLPGATSILAGIREVAPLGVAIEYDEHAHFDGATEKADIGIAVVGEKPYAEGWGDAEIPILSAEDREVVERLQENSERVVVVLVSGRPLFITNEIGSWDALVAAWLPGSEGAGVADVLFGKKKFTGTLPLPWPRTTEQLPIKEDKTADGTTPLFARYFGLKY
jgi:beta-glucosidase